MTIGRGYDIMWVSNWDDKTDYKLKCPLTELNKAEKELSLMKIEIRSERYSGFIADWRIVVMESIRDNLNEWHEREMCQRRDKNDIIFSGWLFI